MKWTPGYSSDQVDDRRDEEPAAAGFGGGGGGGGSPFGLLFWLFSRFGFPGLLVGGAVLYFMSSVGGGSSRAPDPRDQQDQQNQPDQQGPQSQGPDGQRASGAAPTDTKRAGIDFVSFVFDNVQHSWQERFAKLNKPYSLARLELFNRRIRSGCGLGDEAMGPFYCPRDTKVYIDLSFYRELQDRFGAPGNFAQAYVIAHEVGHHVQHLLGIDKQVQGASGATQGALGGSVRLELQADCFAGIWAQSTQQQGLLEAGDVEGALKAASAIGDDRLQKQSTGTVQPETWTHGSSAERMRWFKRGYELGSLEACDTFSAQQL
jgi:predicted metalloprotease